MTDRDYKNIKAKINKGDLKYQKEINLFLLNELKELGKRCDQQIAINEIALSSNRKLKEYIDLVAENISMCVKADMRGNGLKVKFVDPDKYKEEESNAEATN